MLLYVHKNRKAHSDGKPKTATWTFKQLNSEALSLSLSLSLSLWTVDFV